MAMGYKISLMVKRPNITEFLLEVKNRVQKLSRKTKPTLAYGGNCENHSVAIVGTKNASRPTKKITNVPSSAAIFLAGEILSLLCTATCISERHQAKT